MKIRQLESLPTSERRVLIEEGSDDLPRIVYDPFARVFYAMSKHGNAVREVALEDFVMAIAEGRE